MKSRQLVSLGFKFGAASLALAALFLILYFVFRKNDGGNDTNKKPIAWLILSACSYFVAVGGMILVMISYFQMYFPNMGDFNSVQWNNGEMTAGNRNGEFAVLGEMECFGSDSGKDYHQVSFELKNLFDISVTIRDLKVISRIDEKEVEPYRATLEIPFIIGPGAVRRIETRAEVSDRMREHAKKENLDAYGLTAYLTIGTSEGKLPGIPIHFLDQRCHQ